MVQPRGSRREFLALAAAGGTTLAFAKGAVARERIKPPAFPSKYPPDVDSKFYADGRVHPFRGNTLVCHLAQQGPDAACFDALLDVYRDAPAHGFTRKLALLPPSSYHMTVFGGANDKPRLRQSWPADLPLDMPLERCTEILKDRLEAAKISCALPIRMRVDPIQDPQNGRPLTMDLLPFDDAETAKLATVRRAISEATKIPIVEPDTYKFHISVGYSIAWLTPDESAQLKKTFADWARHVRERAPIIPLGAPEFCTFDDMYAFHRLMFLA